jgi:hypothetical protein
MLKECTDKYASIITAKGLGSPVVQEATSIPAPRVTAEEQLAKETEEYLAAQPPPAKRPDPDSDESSEPDEDEDDEDEDEDDGTDEEDERDGD